MQFFQAKRFDQRLSIVCTWNFGMSSLKKFYFEDLSHQEFPISSGKSIFLWQLVLGPLTEKKNQIVYRTPVISKYLPNMPWPSIATSKGFSVVFKLWEKNQCMYHWNRQRIYLRWHIIKLSTEAWMRGLGSHPTVFRWCQIFSKGFADPFERRIHVGNIIGNCVQAKILRQGPA